MPRRAVTVVDLDIGNLQSVTNALRRVGAAVSIASTAREVEDAGILVLPGVGAFERAMSSLRAKGLTEPLKARVSDRRTPLIGICLGMQLLGDRSHEHGLHEGLGLIRGEVVRLEARPPDDRVPNIGWIPVKASRASAIVPKEVDGKAFYHVHSYHLVCSDERDVAATIAFGGARVVTAVERANVFGIQFHPEKSQDAGLDLLHSVLAHLGAVSH